MNKLRRFITSRSFLLFAICYVGFVAIFYLFSWQIGDRRLQALIYRIAGNAMVVFIPYWFLKPRLRPLAVIPVWVFALWSLPNIWYFRLWHDIASSTSLTMAGNAGSLLFNSVRSLTRVSDLLFLLIPAAVTISAFTLTVSGRQSGKYSLKFRCLYIAASILVTFAGELLVSRSISQYQLTTFGKYDHGLIEDIGRRHTCIHSDNISAFHDFGPVQFAISYITDFIHLKYSSIDLNDDERRQIDDLIARHRLEPTDSACGKNLVLLIVESLNSEVVNKRINGHELTPTLNALANDSGTIVALNLVSQIKDGGSSDGQLMINAGLLPMRKGPVALSYSDTNRFPSIRQHLPANYVACAVLADNGYIWSEKKMQLNYGYDSIYTRQGLTEEQLGRGLDAAMFDRAQSVIDTIRQPFLLEMITISMHAPHIEDAVPVPQWLESVGRDDEDLMNYYNMTHYFDHELGRFIGHMKHSGVWENTVMVIASDHNVRSFKEMPDFVPVMFLATNTGRTERIDRVGGQINIYPTILDIMGATDSSATYTGIAPSLLDPTVDGSIDAAYRPYGGISDEARNELIEAYELSDKIHRGRYFGRQ